MKSKDLKNIKEAPGDGRGRAAGSRRTQYRKDSDPEFARVAQSNNQFRTFQNPKFQEIKEGQSIKKCLKKLFKT